MCCAVLSWEFVLGILKDYNCFELIFSLGKFLSFFLLSFVQWKLGQFEKNYYSFILDEVLLFVLFHSPLEMLNISNGVIQHRSLRICYNAFETTPFLGTAINL
jgi:hypothetical protein